MPPKQMLSPPFLFLFFLFTSSMANEAATVPMGSNMATQKDGILNYIPDSYNTLVSRPSANAEACDRDIRPAKIASLVTVQELDTPAKPHPPTCFPEC